MALKFYWGMEDNSNTLGAADYSSGDTTASNSGITGFSGTAAKVGSYGILGTSGVSGNKSFTATDIWPATSTTHNTARGSFGFWMQCPTNLPGSGVVTGLRMQGSTTNYAINTAFESGGYVSLRLHNGAALALYNSTTALSTGVWYFIVCRFDIANDKRAIEVYTDAGGSTLALVSGASTEDTSTDLSSALSASETFDTLAVGLKGTSTGDIYTDNFIISDAYDAPIQNNAFITTYTAYDEAPPGGSIAKLAAYYRMLRNVNA